MYVQVISFPHCTCEIPETRLHLVETRRVADVTMSTLSRYPFLAEDPRFILQFWRSR
jgi:hypothetical protein